MNRRLTIIAALAAAAASTGLFPLLIGGKWFWGGIGAIILVAVIGTATRLPAARALPDAVCLLAALAGLLLYLNLLYSAKYSFGHLFPTGASLVQLWRLAVQGLDDTRRLAAPVPALRGIVLLATAGIGLVAALTDLIAVRLRRCALAGLPLLVLFSVPVTTGAGKNALGDAIVFCLGMGGYLALLSADGQERLRLWGRLVTPWNASGGEAADELESGPSSRALAASGRRIGLAAVVLALFIPLLVPSLHPHKIFPTGNEVPGFGDGPGHGGTTGPDPLVLMNRQLQEARPSVVLTYHTTDQNPQYLQMFVLGNLTNTSWSTSLTGKGVSPFGAVGALPQVPGRPTGHWPTEHTTIQVRPGALDGDSFLPVPYSPRQLNPASGWLADPGTLMLYTDSQSVSGLRYSVTSLDVTPSPAELDQAPADDGAMSQYLSVPPAYQSLAPLARRITAKADTPGARAVALENYFTQGHRFRYSLDATPAGGAAGVRDFLEKSRTGYCQQFAFAMAVLARLLGIPARVVVGYTAGTAAGGGNYTVRTSDAHAWPELYFRGFGWLRMEPTPAGTAVGQGTAYAPAYSRPPAFNSNPGSQKLGGGAGARLRGPLKGGFGHKEGNIGGVGAAAGVGGHPAGGPPVLLIALAALLVVALITPRATRSLTRRRRWLAARSDAARAHAAWLELLDDLTDHGIQHRPGQTPRSLAASVTRLLRLPDPGRRALLRITGAEERASYAREPSPSAGLHADVVTVRGAISVSVTKAARWRARLLPVSAVDRTRQALSHALDVFGWLEVATVRARRRLPRTRPADGG